MSESTPEEQDNQPQQRPAQKPQPQQRPAQQPQPQQRPAQQPKPPRRPAQQPQSQQRPAQQPQSQQRPAQQPQSQQRPGQQPQSPQRSAQQPQSQQRPAQQPQSQQPPAQQPPAQQPQSQQQDKSYRRLAPGEILFKEGEPGDIGYSIVSGKVEIGKLSGGEFVQLAELGPGALFGEMALIDKAPRSATARASGDTVVQEIDERAFNAYIMRNPSSAVNMMKRLSDYVRKSNQALEVSVMDAPSTEEQEGIESSRQTNSTPKLKHDEIQSFQSPIYELQNMKLSRLVKFTFYTMAFFFVSAVLWACFSSVPIYVSTRGKMSSLIPNIEVQSSDSSTVREVLVEKGDRVQKGQIIARLDPTVTKADYKKFKLQFQSNKDLIRRLLHEKGFGSQISIEPIRDALQKEILENKILSHQNQLTDFKTQIQQSSESFKQAEMILKMARLDLESALHEQGKVKRLVNEEILHPIALKESGFKIEKAKASVYQAESKLRLSESSLKNIDKSLKNYLNQRLTTINTELSEAQEKDRTMSEEIIKMEQKTSNTEIRAPESGIVLELKSLFPGAIVSSGQAVLTLVPILEKDEDQLIIEMDIESSDIGNIGLGNEVTIKFDALPFDKHGSLKAKLVYISHDTFDVSVTGTSGTFYRAQAQLEEGVETLKDLPEEFRMLPGLQINADICIGKRVLMAYFIGPFQQTLETSFREP